MRSAQAFRAANASLAAGLAERGAAGIVVRGQRAAVRTPRRFFAAK
jgi:hypothetical protein